MQKKITDLGMRALKTFIQALIPVFVANATIIQSHISSWTWSDWKAWLLPILVSAVAAGLSAVWNLIINAISKTDDSASITENATTGTDCDDDIDEEADGTSDSIEDDV